MFLQPETDLFIAIKPASDVVHERPRLQFKK